MASLVQDREARRTPAAQLWRALQSRYVLGGGYALAALLTAVAILLAAAPPETGPLAPASKNILTILAFNLALILALALQVGHQPAQRRAGQRQEKEGMALRPVAHHVEQWFAMVDEGVQVRQRSRRRAPQCGLPGGRAPPQGGKNDGAAQGSLADGVHGVSAGGRARLMRRILAALPQP